MVRSKTDTNKNGSVEKGPEFMISPEDYKKMLSGIRPIDVSLVKFNGMRKPSVLAPVSVKGPLNVSFNDVVVESTLGKDAKCFEIRAEMGLSVKYEARTISKLDVTFAVTYTSETPVNEDFIKIYKGTSFPLIANPYFREFIQSTMTRMGIRNIVLPLFISGYPKAHQ
jgi:hypothetical protein